MTIAAASYNKHSMILGADTLLSTEGQAKSRPHIPFFPEFHNSKFKLLKYQPERLRQKLVVVSDQICIAYAADDHRRAEHIIELVSRWNIPPEEVNDFVKEEMDIYPKPERRSISFLIGTIRNKKG